MRKILLLTLVLILAFSGVVFGMHEFRALNAEDSVFNDAKREGPWEDVK